MAEAHVRIDEGVKRGPRRQSVARRRNTETNAVEGIPEGLNPKEVLELYLTAETTSQIAQKFGVKRKTLVGWLRKVAPAEWKQVQVVRAEARKEDGNDGLEVADDALSLARAREMIKSAQWDLERLDSANYGQKQEITHVVSDLGDKLRRARERTIEGECAVVQQTPQVIDSVSGAAQQTESKSA
jgi:hypothetical protein